MHDQRDIALEAERVEPSVEVARVIDEAIGAVGGAARIAHPDEVGRETSAEPGEVRNDVAPEVGGGRVAVEEDDRVAAADVHIGHLYARDVDVPA